MEYLPQNEHIKRLPRKRIASATIFLNHKNELLIVKPNYRDGWLTPGGTVEAFESPRAGCIREIKEEIGLDIPNVTLLGINYVQGTLSNGEKDEGIHFVFYGGVLDEKHIAQIKLQKEELEEFKFETLDIACTLLNERLGKRIQEGMIALKNGTTFYSEYKK